jgi:hypothetical protein
MEARQPHHASGTELDEQLQRRVREFAHSKGTTEENVLREAVEAYLAAHNDETAFDRLNRLGLIGCIEEAPADLSTNPAHMEGLGRE